MLLDHAFDMLAWKPEMSRLLLDFDTVPDAPRNVMALCLLTPRFRDFYLDRERIMRIAVADLRAAWAAHPADAALAGLVRDLSRSPEFTRLWDLRDVRVNGRGRKPLRHPGVGQLAVDYEVLNPLQKPGLRLVVYPAADAASQSALDESARSLPAVPADGDLGETAGGAVQQRGRGAA
ncbi:hypothetical protein CLV40_102357 [Actinokineospora auranticolor]|uniref:MmyB-like transcription regulator ligand binding domain-containing protein n=2 Tax=Actinokineospora auranticolor TaxID=155976 RepID=A0A2S6GYW5_9PSEU|nr:hypothetical protein CLV40_102357 [Actinokineospora auranticolor]